MTDKKLLLHICCAPCATGVIQKLKSDGGFDITGYYYNPNIHPTVENEARKDSVRALSRDEKINVMYEDLVMVDYWKDNLACEKSRRCQFCYALRINHIAEKAKEMGFDAFSTTLLISPWQDHETVRRISEAAAEKNRVEFIYQDFRPFYRQGKNEAYRRGYYLQKYCGCIFSYQESDHKKKPVYTDWK